MKTLILVRHAQAASAPQLKDRDRPLTVIGVERAYKTANFLYQQESVPAYWLSSPANRALHTAVIFSKIFGSLSKLRIEEALYTFSMDQLERVVRALDLRFETAILFGHNTGVTDFVNTFGDSSVRNVPTAGAAALEFDVDDWSKIRRGALRTFIEPKKI